jgi:hypothetical protein
VPERTSFGKLCFQKKVFQMVIKRSDKSEATQIDTLNSTNPQLIIVITKRRFPPELRNSHK